MNRYTVFLIAVLAFPTPPALASEELEQRWGYVLTTCLEAATDRATRDACMGRMAAACVDGTDGGDTTLGMGACNQAEAMAWDRQLNTVYLDLREVLKEMDTADMDYAPEHARRAIALRDAQRAWIAFRDADCDLAYSYWGGGSLRTISGSACILETTARRVNALRAKRENFE